MKIPFWLTVMLAFLAAAGGFLLALFGFRRTTSPTPADDIVNAADAEKEKLAAEIKADSDQALLDKFNASLKKEKK